MVRSIGAVVAGYVAMVVIVMLGTLALAVSIYPGGLAALRARMQSSGAASMPRPSPIYLASNIVLSLVAAMMGGWVTLRVAVREPAGHLAALCVVLVVMGVISARRPGSELQPAWYRVVIPIVGVVGVALSILFAPAMV